MEPVSPLRQRGIPLHKHRGSSDPSASGPLWSLPQACSCWSHNSSALFRLALLPNALSRKCEIEAKNYTDTRCDFGSFLPRDQHFGPLDCCWYIHLGHCVLAGPTHRSSRSAAPTKGVDHHQVHCHSHSLASGSCQTPCWPVCGRALLPRDCLLQAPGHEPSPPCWRSSCSRLWDFQILEDSAVENASRHSRSQPLQPHRLFGVSCSRRQEP